MNRLISAVLTASALIFGVFLPREEAVAQTAKDLVGTWVFVSSTLEQGGKKIDYWGSNPVGQVMFDLGALPDLRRPAAEDGCPQGRRTLSSSERRAIHLESRPPPKGAPSR